MNKLKRIPLGASLFDALQISRQVEFLKEALLILKKGDDVWNYNLEVATKLSGMGKIDLLPFTFP